MPHDPFSFDIVVRLRCCLRDFDCAKSTSVTIAVSRATKEETRFPLTLHNVRVRQITWERVR